MAGTNVYEIITERVLTELESGVAPWRKPWRSLGGPHNLKTGKAYRGINVFLLGWGDSPWWLTFNQAKELGGSVKKGEKSSLCVFWQVQRYKDKVTGEPKSAPILRYYRVFNLSQCEDVRIPKGREAKLLADVSEDDSYEAAEKIISGYGDAPEIRHGSDGAWYRPTVDRVDMPNRTGFTSLAGYYSTLFHELGHSTGHSSRLKRFGDADFVVHSFGSAEYGREELIAEMTAAFLCGEAGLLPDTMAQSAAYIENWRRVIKDDPKAIVVAAGRAQKAADHILGRVIATEETTETAEPVDA